MACILRDLTGKANSTRQSKKTQLDLLHTNRRFAMFALMIFCIFMTRDAKSPKVPHGRTYQE